MVTKEKEGEGAAPHRHATCNPSKQNTRDNRTSHRNPRAPSGAKQGQTGAPQKQAKEEKRGHPAPSPNHRENGKRHPTPHQHTANRAPGPKQARDEHRQQLPDCHACLPIPAAARTDPATKQPTDLHNKADQRPRRNNHRHTVKHRRTRTNTPPNQVSTLGRPRPEHSQQLQQLRHQAPSAPGRATVCNPFPLPGADVLTEGPQDQSAPSATTAHHELAAGNTAAALLALPRTSYCSQAKTTRPCCLSPHLCALQSHVYR